MKPNKKTASIFDYSYQRGLLVPDIENIQYNPAEMKTVIEEECDKIKHLTLSAPLTGDAKGTLVNDLYVFNDRIICKSKYRLNAGHKLKAWNIIAEDIVLNSEKVHAYIGQHGDLGMGALLDIDNVDISTASHNWAYSPMAPRVLFQQGENCIVLGGTSPAHDFGLQCKITDNQMDWFRFDYGGDAFPQQRIANEWHHGPRLQILRCGKVSVQEAHAAFTQAMIEDGIVPVKKNAPESSRWRSPSYCTWGDQVIIAKASMMQEQGGAQHQRIKAVLDQDIVLRAAHKIRDNNLNIKTIIIDSGWQDFRGDWNLDTDKFPDMRALTDELHSMGLNVAFWWAPFLTEGGANVLASGRVTGPLKFDQIVVDYTKPETREWLQGKLHQWFGDGRAQWNMDGVKLDFMQDKVYPQETIYDLDWYGEERLFSRLLAMISGVMAVYNKPSGIFAIPYNPNFMQYCVLNSLEERFDENLEFMREKTELINALTPGLSAATHFNYNIEIIPKHIEAAYENGFIPQLGLLLADEVTESDLSKIREALKSEREDNK